MFADQAIVPQSSMASSSLYYIFVGDSCEGKHEFYYLINNTPTYIRNYIGICTMGSA